MDYQGNSNTDKLKAAVPERTPKDKVVTGEVILKEKGVGSRFKGIFFGGDLQSSVKMVAADVLLPALRSLVLDMIYKGSQSLILGEDAPRRRTPSSSYAPRIRYDNPAASTRYLPDQKPVETWARERKSIKDVIVATRPDADLLVESIQEIVDNYQVLSVADVYELLGVGSSAVDNKWGWVGLPHMEVRQVQEGWHIKFPPLEVI